MFLVDDTAASAHVDVPTDADSFFRRASFRSLMDGAAALVQNWRWRTAHDTSRSRYAGAAGYRHPIRERFMGYNCVCSAFVYIYIQQDRMQLLLCTRVSRVPAEMDLFEDLWAARSSGVVALVFVCRPRSCNLAVSPA